MDLELTGKHALVTGASSGLGASAAMELAAEGAEVTINSRSEERLDEVAETIATATGTKPNVLAGDLSNEADLDRLCKTVSRARIDIFVSNSGGPPVGQFTDLSSETWDDACDLLLRPAVRLTRAVIDGMIERRFGRLIYITSIAVLQPVDDLILSNTYRAGVTAFCKTVSNNYARHGITANCVCPGYTATERLISLAQTRAENAGKTPDEIMAGFASAAAAGRVGQPEELAALIAFLAGTKAAFITGCSIPVDGGANKALI
ncbi:MAG TPA: SDR family oxidoreductase [Acidobacteriota bacterium]|nr:SDR family oxidoreductase [Acidobacteriota bacterium]